MALTINSNISSLNAQRNLGKISSRIGKSIERLSSGLRINNAADDAAGLAIATKLGSQVRGLNQAVRNANNAITLTQTAEGGINTVTNILHRLRELAVQSSSDDNTSSDRANLASEATNLTSELTRMVNTTEFNTLNLLDGSFSSRFFQVGANFSQKVTFSIGDVRGKSIGGRAELSANVADGVTAAVDENFGTGEIKINGADVAATSATDDQYSVLSVGSAIIASAAATMSGSYTLNLNGTDVAINSITLDQAGSTIAASIAAAINAASITNITARTVNNGEGFIVEAKNGANLNMAIVSNGADSTTLADITAGFGLTNVVTMVGSGGAAEAVNNYNGESSAIAKTAAINAVKTQSGVLASSQSQSVTGDAAVTAGSIAAGDVYINGVDIGAVTVTTNDGTGALLTAINNQTSNTGVSATTDNNGKLALTAADGRNITVSVDDTTARDIVNLSGTDTNLTVTYRSTVQLNDDEAFTLTAASSLEDLTGAAGTSVSAAADVGTYNIASMTIDTQASAEASILTIDAALDDVNGIRANIGAVQNRLEFTVSNLEVASENSAAAESRILDADFAVETALFTRNQIMIQAATAMLAQANTLPQAALQLLG